MSGKKLALLCVACLSICLTAVIGCGGIAAVSIALNSSSLNVDGTDTVTITATVTNDHNSAGVSWAVSGGGTLSNQTTSAATYTAPAATSSPQTVTVTATSIADTTKTATITLTVQPAPSITTAGPLQGAVGTAYSVNLAANGGISPYTWSVASGSTLPTGVTLSSSGQIAGTPPASAAGTTSVTFSLKDSGTPTALTASKAISFVIAPAPAFSFVGTMPASAGINTNFNGSASATGGAGTLTYNVVSGTLPSGTSLNTSTGAVTGTLTAAGAFTFKIGVADAYGDAGSNTYTVTVSYPPMNISTGSLLSAAYVNGNYSQALAATGGTNVAANYSWSLTGGTLLPAGLNLSVGGVISGKPTGSTGTTQFTAQVTDTVANLSTTQSFSITVNPGVSITTASTLGTGYAGSNYSVQLGAVGGSGTGYTWTVTSGSTLPAGLTLSSGGLLSGKPTATGPNSFNITVTDSVSNTANLTFSLTVAAGVSITSLSTLPKGYQGAIYPGATLTATGGTGTGYSWSWAPASGSAIPTGLSLNSATGVVSGTPTTSGTFSVVVTVNDSVSNSTTQTVSITIEAALAISPSTLPAGTVNVAYSQTLTATGGSGTGYTWASLANTNPALGITLSAGGVISGTATTTGSTTITAQVTDSESHQTSSLLTVTVYSAITITTTTLPAGNQGSAYSQTLAAAGGSGSGYTWTATSSNLASYGLSLSNAGVVSGTPTQSGTATFTAQVTDSGSNTTTQSLSIQIYGALSLPPGNSLPTGYTTVAYTGAITGSGGSGNLSISITSALSPSNGTLGTSISSNTVNITGTPTTATTESLTVKLTDTTTNALISQAYTFTINTATAPSLPVLTLPAATVNQTYSSSITATGGVGPNYTWTVNSNPVPTNGSTVSLGSGVTVSNTGNNVLTLGGTPSATGTVSFTAQVKDTTTNLTSSTQGYSITVNSAGSQVSGNVSLTNVCGGTSSVPPTITLSINTTSAQQVQTDSSGNYSFGSIPNGTYTITPSITGPSSVFFPATMNVTVNNGNLTGENFNVSLGYQVSGTVSYAGAKTGQVYLSMVNSNCGGNGGSGTSIALSSGSGPFTIRGVAPGSYTLKAWMDPSTLAEGYQNTSDPSGSTSGVTVSNANLSGQSITLTDPTVTVPSSGPGLKAIAPMDQGVVISFKGGSVTNSNGLEEFTSYTVQWATTTGGFSNSQQATFKAVGPKNNIWILTNGIAGISGSLSNGTAYYFRVMGSNSAGNSGWTVWGGGTPATVTIGAPSGGGYNTVTGAVTIPGTVTPTGPLFVGFFDQNTNTAYGTEIVAPSNVSANAYTVSVPNGSSYINFAILDQNNNGMIDSGDVTNVRNGANTLVTVSGSLTGQNLTLPASNATVVVQTQYQQNTYNGGSSSGYAVTIGGGEGNKLPVAMTITAASNPNVVVPFDISNYCQGCGSVEFQTYQNIGNATPNVGDTYTLTVKYDDGTSDTGVNATVTAFGSTGAVVGPANLITNLLPSGSTGPTAGTRNQPTLTWTYPSGSSTAGLSYNVYVCCGTNGDIWDIPGQNSNSNGFTYSQIPGASITWGVDPTNGSNTPSSNLTTGTQYNLSISAQDSIGNSAQTTTYYIP